jgi:hypothetical protein
LRWGRTDEKPEKSNWQPEGQQGNLAWPLIKRKNWGKGTWRYLWLGVEIRGVGSYWCVLGDVWARVYSSFHCPWHWAMWTQTNRARFVPGTKVFGEIWSVILFMQLNTAAQEWAMA